MKTTTMTMPRPALVIGEAIDTYPNGWDWPYTSLIREFWRPNHPEVLANPEEGYEVTYPGYGVITFRGRKYTFVPTAEYARAKGYPPQVEGSWG